MGKTTAAPQLPLDQVLQGDCIDILASLPAESIDLIFADPPYNLQLHQELWRPDQTRVDPVNDAWDHFDDFQAYDHFTSQWLAACRRVLKRNGTLWVIGSYHNIFRVGSCMQDLGFWILNDIVWIKNNPMPNFRGVRFTNAHEMLVWAQKERGTPYTFNHHAMKSLNDDLQMRSDWYLPICTGSERLRLNGEKAHSTQKPESLLYRVILASSQPGDVVLDPFFGTGTTGAVARRLQRRWIGIERQAEYVELARQRIARLPVPTSDAGVFALHNPRKARRVPFGMLLEYGLLQPGQLLYLAADADVVAHVQSDGLLECQGRRGSIHQAARQFCRSTHAPCNGWQQWLYVDPQSGERHPINELREQLRAQFISNQPQDDQL
jgi:site-specific DNA-methyltransferase (adenine-specific)